MVDRISITAIALLMLAPAAVAAPDESRPPREARSSNGRFTLRLEPGRPGRGGQPCRAALYEQAPPSANRRRVWERALVNDAAPALAFVRDDGRYVVTLDEYRRGGARHALVIYGAEGELLRHFLLPDLLTRADWSHVRSGRREIRWLNDARCTFDERERFVIALNWGRRIVVNLAALRVEREGESIAAELSAVPAAILNELLVHANVEGERTVAERLAELGRLSPAEQAQANQIAAQLGAGADRPTPISDADTAATTPAAPDDRPITSAEQPHTAIPLPPPNAADKTDYVSWFNDLGRMDETCDAGPLYEQAIAALTPWDGDEELYRAAESGDPAALQAPEIAAWLAANAAALENFELATAASARGWQRTSSDGSLTGMLMPELGSMRQLAKLEVLEGRRLAAAGEPAAAVDRFLAAFDAGEHLRQGPTLVEQLVGLAIQTRSAEALLDVQAGNLGPFDYPTFATTVAAAAGGGRPLADVLQTERAAFLDVTQRSWDYDRNTGEYVVNPEQAAHQLALIHGVDASQVETLVAQTAEAGYESTLSEGNLFYDSVADALAQPFPAAMQRLAALEAVVSSSQTASPLLRGMAGAMQRCLAVQARGEATTRAAGIVAHLREHHSQTGAYPDTLDALGDMALTIDPYTGRRFAYRPVGDDFVLYSVGRNGADDGGVHDPRGETNDLVFWPRP